MYGIHPKGKEKPTQFILVENQVKICDSIIYKKSLNRNYLCDGANPATHYP